MKVTFSWLKEFVDITLSPKELAEALTMAGLEVESYEEIKRHFSHVLVGKVLSYEKHPSAEKLHLCRVDAGGREYSIVCGAPNVAVGIHAPFALPNSILQGQQLQSREIRGVLSEGMLCSEAELGLSERAEGLMLLDDRAKPGMDVQVYLGEPDYVFDIFITPNRPDCLSVIGLAREIAAITRKPLQKNQIKVQSTADPVEKYIQVEIQDIEHCYRYSGRFLKNVRIKSSPFWMAYRLHHAGLRSINNIVDITNYVMLETGHPMHAFDYRQIDGKKIIVRSGKKGETFTTLDGKSHLLDDESCLICDTSKPIALAGIMGGLNSEVQEDTDTVFLESAYFEPTNIRRTAKRLEITSESSKRFERGADPNATIFALDRATQLMSELAEAQALGTVVDCYRHKVESVIVLFSLDRCNSLLGTTLTQQDVKQILPALEIESKKVDHDLIQLTIPSFRPDLTRDVDIIEEIARLYGYDNIPFCYKASIDQRQSGNERIEFLDQLRTILSCLGLDETLSLSLVAPTIADLFLKPGTTMVELVNPLSSEWSVFRTNLLISVLNNVAYNRNRQKHNLRLFEIGNAAWRTESTIIERKQVVGILAGKRSDPVWYEKSSDFDFYDIKGTVIDLLKMIGIENYQLVPAEATYWDQQSAGIVINKKQYLGTFGKLNKEIVDHLKIKIDDIYGFNFDFDLLFANRRIIRIFDPIPKFPSVPFDLALLLDATVPVGDVEKAIAYVGGSYLQSIQLFDFYDGEQIPAGKKSVAFSLTFSSKERTLDIKEIDESIRGILEHLNKQFGAELRQH